jgi:DHA2 family methylenomycin A resistance protein-like MFS transporter
VITGMSASLSGRATARLGEWPVMLGGLSAGALAAVLVALPATHGPLRALIACAASLGATAFAMPAMTAVAMASAPAQRIGLASGVLNTSRQTGGAFGVAVLGALLASGGAGHVSLQLAFAAIAGAYAVGALLALFGRVSCGGR